MSVIRAAQDASLGQWVFLALVICPLLVYLSFFWKQGTLVGAPPLDSEGIPGLGPLRFWTDRTNYLRDAARRSKNGNFSFYVGSWPVIGLSGPSGRAAYYNSGLGLELTPGMNALVIGGTSILAHDPSDKNVLAKKGWNSYTRARLLETIRPAKLRAALPTFFTDCLEAFSPLGASGSFDPMTDIYQLAWRMSMQALGPSEIYNSPALLKKTFDMSIDLDIPPTPLTVLFPWLPTPGKLRKTIAGIRLFMTISSVVKAREKARKTEAPTTQTKAAAADSGTSAAGEEDGLDTMLAHGDHATNAIKQTIEMLFAAQINTAQTAATTLCNLGAYPAWQRRVRAEVAAVAAEHARDPSAPLHVQLQDVPADVWTAEPALPVLYACLKDSIRMQSTGSICRMNMTGQPIPLATMGKDGVVERSSSEVVPPRAILCYNATEARTDEALFPDADAWNPGRFLAGDAAHGRQGEREVAYADSTWGGGKHVCTGMKLAKLELRVIVAMFVAMFEWDLRDGKGEVLGAGVPASWGRWMPTRHEEAYRLRYKRRDGDEEKKHS